MDEIKGRVPLSDETMHAETSDAQKVSRRTSCLDGLITKLQNVNATNLA
jgi:hypothetical protein